MANINRVDTIAAAVSQAFHISGKDNDRKDARDVFQAAASDAVSERETLLTSLAAAADQHDMSDSELTMALDKAKAQRNNQKDTSINTFASEIKRACHPSVRKHVGELFTLAAEAWENEKDQDDQPLRKAFSRRYHMVVGAMFNAAIAGDRPTNATALADMALDTIRKRERDYTKIYQRLQAIKEQLAKFARDFPVDGITCCVDFLDSIKKDELRECVVVVTVSKDETPAQDAPVVEEEPMEGESDLLQDALDDVTSDAA